MTDTLVKVENVSKKFCRSLKRSLWYGLQDLGSELVGRRHGGNGGLRPDEFWAVKDVSFELKRGECLGLIGRNGAGKTTLLRMLNGLIKPDAGRIEMCGRVGALIALGAGFNPILTGRENIYVSASVLGLTKHETDQSVDEIIDFSGISDFIDAPVQSYSSGMTVRLGFAIATTIRPEILILDEVLAVGDVTFRDKCYQRVGELLRDSAVVVVSHDANSIHRLADTAIFLDRGQTLSAGPTDIVLAEYSKRFKSLSLDPQTTTSEWLSDLALEASVRNRRKVGQVFAFDLVIRVSFFAERNVSIAQALGNITGNLGNGPIAGQFDFRESLKAIRRGHNALSFMVPSVCVSAGEYTCTIVVFCCQGRELAFSARNFFAFDETENIRFGAMYALAAETLDLTS